jgi:surfactin synthase thioesterase subunit
MRSAVRASRTSTAGRPAALKIWRPSPTASVRLVCWPWCGAGASVYRKLAHALPESLELVAIQLPGREDRYGETLARCMDLIVADNLAALLAAASFDGRPTVFFGHSMGAIVAGEVAFAMREHASASPKMLVLSGHGAPVTPRPDSPMWHDADNDALLANLSSLGGTPPAVLRDSGMMKTLLPVLRADYEALETHRPVTRPPLRCPIVACAGAADTLADAAALGRWASSTTGVFSIETFDGGHFYLVDEVTELAARLAVWINRAVRVHAW